MARLIISAPNGKRGILELTKPVITIGRGTANDLVLNDTSVSRLHAVVKQSDAGVVIADRGSTNGVAINGTLIDGETLISNGDLATIGAFEIRFESVDDVAFDIQSGDPALALNEAEVISRAAGVSAFAEQLPIAVDELATRVRKLERENYLLSVIHDASKALHGKISREEIVEELMSLVFRMEGVERGCFFFVEEDGGLTQGDVYFRKQRKNPRADHGQLPELNLSRAVLERIRSERQPLLINDLRSDARFEASESLKLGGIRSAMCAPLVGKERMLGLVYVDNLNRSDVFTQDELNVFALLASQAALAIDSALAHRKLAEHSAQRAALERFLAPEVVEMIASGPEVGLGGVNQKATILFADIRNFTGISENMPPEKVVEMLNEYFSRVTDVIFDHGGTLDKFLGDGVMAVFGAPISKGNDAANAVRAAIEIQRLMAELNQDAAARGRPELKAGIGINTGIVTAGNIGSVKRLDYTVIGDAVNIASRLTAHAVGGQILVSDSTAAELDASFKLGGRKPVMLKGKSAPVPVMSVRWLKAKAAKPN